MNSDSHTNNPSEKNQPQAEAGWLSMSEASKLVPYSAEYLSLLARKKKIASKKVDNIWYTTKPILDDYMKKQMIRVQVQSGNLDAVKPLLDADKADHPLNPVRTYYGDLKDMGMDITPPVSKVKIGVDEEKKEPLFTTLKNIWNKEESLEPTVFLPARDASSSSDERHQVGGYGNEGATPSPFYQLSQSLPAWLVARREKAEAALGQSKAAAEIAGALEEVIDRRLPVAQPKPTSLERQTIVYKDILSSKTLVAVMVVSIVSLTLLPVPIVFSFFEKSLSALREAVNDSNTVMGLRPGTHANEILLLDKEGNVSIMGHIETEGQLRSFAPDGTAPIVVDSTTMVENLNAEMVGGVGAGEFTLAFITKNGNVTTEDVILEGNVEVGKTLKVRGATQLQSALSVGGNLTTFGKAQFRQALEVLGPAYFDALVTMQDDLLVKGDLEADGNIEARKNIFVTGSVEVDRSVVAGNGVFGSLSSTGDFSAGGQITLGSAEETITINTENMTLNEAGDVSFEGTLTVGGAIVSGGTITIDTGSFTNLTVTHSTSTHATSTSFYSSVLTAGNATSTNFFAVNGVFDNLTAGIINGTDLTYVNATGTNSTTTNAYIASLMADLGTISDLTSTQITTNDLTTDNLNFTNSTGTNATTTNFFTNLLTSTLARITSLVVDDASVGALTATNSTTTNATTTNLYSSQLATDNLQFTNATGTNLTVNELLTTNNLLFTNATGTSATTTNFFSTTGRFTNLFSDTFNVTDLTFTNATGTNATTTNLFSTTGRFTSLYTSLTSGRVPYIGTDGLLTDSASFLWENSLSRLTAPYASTTALSVSGTAYLPGSGIWNSSGNVGIGTTSPTEKLHIVGNIKASNFSTIALDSVFAGTNAGMSITPGAGLYNTFIGTEAGEAVVSGDNNVLIGRRAGKVSTGSNNVYLGSSVGVTNTSGSNNILIGFNIDTPTTTTSNYLSIGNLIYGNTSTGNVGIGTTAPGYDLEISATAADLMLRGTNEHSYLRQDRGGTQRDSATVYTVNDTQEWAVGVLGASVATGDNFSIKALGTGGAGSVLSINRTSGNVGIGTTSPFAKLSVAGDTYIGGNLTATGTVSFLQGLTSLSNLLVTGSSTLQNFTFVNATGTNATTTNLYFSNNLTGPGNFIVNSSGNVGIGAVSPSVKLQVTNSSLADGQNIVSFVGNSGSAYEFVNNGTFNINNGGHATFPGNINFNGGEAHVGTVAGTWPNRNFAIKTYNGDIQLLPGNLNTTAKAVIVKPGANSTATFQVQKADSTAVLSVDTTNGNVGIGTASPNGLLHLNSSILNNPMLIVRNTNTTAGASVPLFLASNSGGSVTNVSIENSDAGDLMIRTGATSESGFGTSRLTVARDGRVGIGADLAGVKLNIRGATSDSSQDALRVQNAASTALLVVRNDGNVGIGTTNPGEKLDVNGSIILAQNSPLKWYRAGTEYDVLNFDGNGDVFMKGALNNSSDIFFQTMSSGIDTTRMTILNNGNVGIGTTSPAQKLSVAGNGYFTGGLGIGTATTTPGALHTTGDAYIGGNLTIAGSAMSSALTGQFQFLANPTGTNVDEGTVYINPGSAGTNNVLLGIAVGGTEKFRVDAEGDVQVTGLFNSTNTAGTNSFSGGLSVLEDVALGTDSSNTLTVNSRISSNLIPSLDNTYDLGSPALRWANFYSTNAIFDSITTASSTEDTFILNSDNATADAEDSSIQFSRGTEVPNAIIKWDSTLKRFDFNNFPVHLQNKLVVSGTASSSFAGPLWVTGTPQGTGLSDASLFVNPSSSSANYMLFSIGVAGVQRFSVDAEGDTLAHASLGIENALFDITDDTLTINDKLKVVGNEIVDSGDTTRLTLGSTNTITGNLSVTGDTLISGDTTISSLTSGRVPFASTGGLLTDSSLFTFDSTVGRLTTTYASTTALSSTDFAHLATSGGRVGIGTTNPLAKFVVDESKSGTSVGDGMISILQGASALNARTELGFSYSGASSVTHAPALIGYQATTYSGGTSGSFYIATRDVTTDTAPTQRLTILPGGNVGVGTTNPLWKFTVTNSTGASDVSVIDSSGNGVQLTSSSGTGYVTTNSANPLVLRTNGAEVMRLTSGGSVGIGTTTPSARLSVTGTTANSSGRAFAVADSANAERFSVLDNGVLTHTFSTGSYQLVQRNTGYLGMLSGAGGYLMSYDVLNNRMSIGNSSTLPLSKLQIDGNQTIGSGYVGVAAPTNGLIVEGNVGIGTTSPLYKLHVAGTGRFTGSVVMDSDLTVTGNISSPGTGANSEKFGAGATAAGTQGVSFGYNASADVSYGIAIGGFASSGERGIALGRLASTVGINGVAIGYDASANDVQAIAIGSAAQADSEAVAIGQGASAGADGIAIGRLAVTTGEGIAIGWTASAGANQLVFGDDDRPINDVYFSSTVDGLRSTNIGLRAPDTTGADKAARGLTIAGGRSTGTGLGGSILFQTAGAGSTGSTLNSLSDRMIITSAGNVGIGTTSPFTKLSVAGSAYIGGNFTATGTASILGAATFSSTLTASGLSTFTDRVRIANGTAALPSLAFADDTDTGIHKSDSDTIGFSSGGTAYWRVSSVLQSLNGGKLMVSSNGTVTNPDIKFGSADEGIRYFNDSISIVTGATDTAIIGGSGIKIGASTNPLYRLDIVSDTNHDAISIAENVGGEAWQFGINAAGDLKFEDDGVERITFQDSGNVGIGTAAPGGKLSLGTSAVSGTAGVISGFRAYENGTTVYGMGVSNDSLDIAANVSTGNINFYTGGSNAAPNNRMVINSSGNVGIGTTSPANKLHVVIDNNLNEAIADFQNVATSGIARDAYVRFRGTSTYSEGFHSQTSQYRITEGTNLANADTRFAIAPTTGHVGIGTTTLTYARLGVVGSTTNSTLGNVKIVEATNSGSTFNTGGGVITNYGIYANNTATRSLGANALTNVGIYASASGAQNNYAAIFENGNVGIGTTSPFAKLSVAGDTYIGGNLTATGTVSFLQGLTSLSNLLVTGSSTLQNFTFVNATGTNATTTNLYFSNNLTGPGNFIVNSSGNVGVGTVAPTSALEIGSGQIEVPAGSAVAPSYSFADQLSTGFYRVSGSTVGFSSDGTNTVRLGSDGIKLLDGSAASPAYGFIQDAGNGLFRAGADTLGFAINGAEKVRIDSMGNVGIGTTSPFAKLAVNPVAGDANQFVVGSSTATSLIINSAGDVGIGSATPLLGSKLYVEGRLGVRASSGDSKIRIYKAGTTGGYVDQYVDSDTEYWMTNANSKTFLHGNWGGDVAVGGAVPGNAQFSVVNSSSFSSILKINDSSNNTVFNVLDTGNVGIGTTSPQAKLVVADGDIQLNGDGAYKLAFGVSAPSYMLGVSGSSGYLGLGVNDSRKMTILSSGKVGIGTITPSALLTVAGTGQFTNSSDPTSGTGVEIGYSTVNSQGSVLSYDRDTATYKSLALYGSDIVFDVGGGADEVTINSSGNVGIGTTTPWGKLSVTNTGTSPSFVVEDATSPDSTPFIILATGNVGIGTANPDAKLQVEGAIRATSGSAVTPSVQVDDGNTGLYSDGSNILYFAAGGSTVGSISANRFLIPDGTVTAPGLSFNDQSNTGFYRAASEVIGISTGGTERMRIDGAGNIGIGTTSPSAKLSITGSGATTGRAFALANSSNVEKFTILDNGRVGIGVKSPNSPLEIDGNGGVDALRIDYVASSLPSSYYGLISHGGNVGGIDGLGGFTFIAQSAGSGEFGGNIVFGKKIGSGTPTTQMIIRESGNVGIGTTTPGAKLHVSGNIYLPNSGIIRFDDGVGPQIYESSNGIKIKVGSGGTTNGIDIDGNGNTTIGANLWVGSGAGGGTPNSNVGIGTTTPWGKLSITNTGSDPSFVVEDSASADSSPFIITSNGDVGIGIVDPGGKLDVQDGSFLLTDADVAHGVTGITRTATFGKFAPISSTGGGLEMIGLSDTDASGLRLISIMGASDPTDTTPAIILEGRKANGTSSQGLANAETVLQVRNSSTNLLTVLGSGNVGIGTTTPSERLHIYGNTNATSALILENTNNSSSAYSNIKFKNDSGSVMQQIQANSSTATDLANGFRLFADGYSFNTVGGTERMRLTTSGNVGIGTTSPSRLLHLNSASGVSSAIQFDINSTLGAVLGVDKGANILSSADAGDLALRYVNDFQIGTNVTDTMRLTSAGNVGIGTTDPSEKLHVSGNLLVTGNSTTTNATTTNFFSTTGRFTNLFSDTFNVSDLIFTNATGTNATTTNLYFSNNLTGPGNFIVNSSGNVGVGTVSPSSKLHVASAVTYLGSNTSAKFDYSVVLANSVSLNAVNAAGNSMINLIRSDSSDNTYVGYAGNTIFGSGNNNERVRIDSSGNVGIGTAAPTYKLDVQGTNNTVGVRVLSNTDDDILYYGTGTVTGDINLLSSAISATGIVDVDILNSNSGSSTASARLNLQVAGANAGDPYISYTVNGVQNWTSGIDNSDSDKFKISSGSTPDSSTRLTIDTSGNVGIGTTSPFAKLAINPVAGDTNQFVVGSSTATSFIINPAGNVGVGTANPGYKLDVNSGTDNMVFNGVSTDAGAYIRLRDNDANGWYFGANTGRLGFYTTGDSEKLTILNSGNVGIGIASPSYSLEVAGDAGFNEYLHHNDDAGTYLRYQTDQADLFAGGSGLTVKSGNVGIGTTTPQSKLVVAGLSNSGIAPVTGTTLTLDSTTSDNFLNIISNSSNIAGVVFGHQTSNFRGSVEYNHLSNIMNFKAGGNSIKMTLDGATGNLGIGDTTPDYLLDVSGTLGVDGTATFMANLNANGGLDIDDAFVVADGGALTTSQLATFNGILDANGVVTLGDNGENVTIDSSVWDITAAGAVSGLTGITSSGNITFSSLTSGRVPFASTGGLLTDSSLFTFDSTVGRLTTTYASTTALSSSGFAHLATSGGRVGIGTTNPLAKFVVDESKSGTSVGDGMISILQGASALNARTELGFSYSGASSVTQAPALIGYQVTTLTGGTSGSLYLATRDSTDGNTAPTQRLTILPGGNVGIGETNPSVAKLQVSGSGYFTEGLSVGDSNINTGVVNVGTGFRIGNAATANAVLRGNGTNFVSSAAAALTKTDDDNVTLTLGGTPATALLDSVSLTLGWTGQLSVPRGGTGAATFTSNGVLYGNGTSALGVTDQGGANTILTANGGAPSFSASPTIGTSVTTPLIIGGTAADSSLTLRSTSGVGTSDHIKFQVGNNGASEAMRITTQGRLGLGVIDPIAHFTINQATTTTDIGGAVLARFQGANAANSRTELGLTYAGASGFYSPVVLGYQATSFSSFTSGSFYIATRDATTDTAPTQRLTILPGGNVGIGTSTPDGLLHVVGESAKFFVEDPRVGGEWMRFSAGTAGSSMKFSNTGIFAIGPVSDKSDTSIASSFVVSETGNVGIGTTSPTHTLAVAGSAVFGGASAGNASLEITGQSTASVTLRTPLSDHIYFGTSGVNRLGISNSGGLSFGNTYYNVIAPANTAIFEGNVGIGTTSPFAKLSVAGDTYIGGNLTATGTASILGATTLSSTLNVSGLTTLGHASTTQISSTGSAYFATTGGSVGIGTTSPADGTKVEISYTDSTNRLGYRGLSVVPVFSGNASQGGDPLSYFGADISPTFSSSFTGGDVPSLNALNISPILTSAQSFGGGNHLHYAGVGITPAWTGSITDVGESLSVYGVRLNNTQNLGTTGNTTSYGFNSTISGTADTNYGIYLTTSGATENYDIFASSASANNYFAGNVGIGTTSPGQLLHVESISSDAATLFTTQALTPGSSGDTGAVSAGTGANDASVGTVSWQLADQITASDNIRARLTGFGNLSNAVSNYLMATDFGFSIPAGATISGVEVEIEKSDSLSSGSAVDYSVKIVKGGSVAGSDQADTVNAWPNTDAYTTYGDSSDLWGTTITVADVNASDFGVAIAAETTTSAGFARPQVDHVRITVYYTIADVTGTQNFVLGIDQNDSGKFKISGASTLGSSDYFTLTSLGNIGIGTTSPFARLAVNPIAGDANQFVVGSSTRTSFIISSSGNVGIGTTNPGAPLEVSGRISQIGLGGSTFLGFEAGLNDDGSDNHNVGVGYHSLYSNTNGFYNTATGHSALYSNTTGTENTASGLDSLRFNTSGSYNTATGNSALYTNITGGYNTATGNSALYANTDGAYNAAYGGFALYSNTTGSYNTAMGLDAGRYIADGSTANITGSNSLFLGRGTRASADGETNQIVIGESAIGNGSNSVTLGNDSITKTILKGNVGIGTTTPWKTFSVTGAAGFDGLTASTGAGSICLSASKELVYNAGSDACLPSLRDTKHDITALSMSATESINALNPVSFVYNEGDGRVRYGFIAEEVAAIDDFYATRNAEGKLTGIDDRALIALLIKGFKELNTKVTYNASSTEAALDDLDSRVFALENASATTTVTDSSSLLDTLVYAGMQLGENVTHFMELAVDKMNATLAYIESAFIKDLYVENKFCVDDVCVDKEQLKQMLLDAGGVYALSDEQDPTNNEQGDTGTASSTDSTATTTPISDESGQDDSTATTTEVSTVDISTEDTSNETQETSLDTVGADDVATDTTSTDTSTTDTTTEETSDETQETTPASDEPAQTESVVVGTTTE